MTTARRAQFGMSFAETSVPGIEMNVDGSMEGILPDGSRFALDGSGGGALVGCTLICGSLDVRTGPTGYPILWNNLIDNLWDYNTLPGIPDGLGLSFAFDGTDAEITVTEAGVFAMTVEVTMGGTDATWEGTFVAGSYLLGAILLPQKAAATAAGVGILPVGAAIAPQITTDTSATSDPWVVGVTLQLVRLGDIS